MQSLAEWKFGSGNVGDKNKKKKTACKPRTASAYGHAVKKKKKKKTAGKPRTASAYGRAVKNRVSSINRARPMAARLIISLHICYILFHRLTISLLYPHHTECAMGFPQTRNVTPYSREKQKLKIASVNGSTFSA